MSGFIMAFLAVLLSGLAARDQLTLAALVRAQSQRPALLIIAVLLCLVTAAIASWGASLIAPLLASNARLLMLAVALLFGGIECLLQSPQREAKEPTQSLTAYGLVMASHQLTDAARFLILTVGLAVNAPVPAGLGGAAGGIVLLGAAWAAPDYFQWQLMRKARRTIGVLLFLLGLFLGLRAMGQI